MADTHTSKRLGLAYKLDKLEAALKDADSLLDPKWTYDEYYEKMDEAYKLIESCRAEVPVDHNELMLQEALKRQRHHIEGPPYTSNKRQEKYYL